jgi:ubiquinone/menaquinone biosynthesis C-methylase UbiE
MDEDRLYCDAAMARFYDLDNGWTEDRAFSLMLARERKSVLDLGCGTGELALRVAALGIAVTGVDPAHAMLDIARRKPGADKVRWVSGDARTLNLDRRFDLIVMTGHAFQVFVTTQDRLSCLETIARHLAPSGRFIFDTRNPEMREWEEWLPETTYRHIDDPVHGRVSAWNDVNLDADTGIVTYQTVYRIDPDGPEFRAASRIGFADQEEVKTLLTRAGLKVCNWYGDWSGAPFAPGMPEIIVLGTRG